LELSSGAKEDNLRLVGVELQAVLQDRNHRRTAAEQCASLLMASASAVSVYADEQLRFVSELVA